MKRLAVLAAATLLGLPSARADDAAPLPAADDPVTLKALSARLHDEARDIRAAAEVTHAQAQNECWKKFLVSRCLEQAGQAHRDEKLKAAKLEGRARAIERELKRREIAGKDAKRAEQEAAQGKP